MITLDVMGIRLAPPDDVPILLLHEREGSRVLPIWISSVDAAAIAVVLDGDTPFARPLTHDLLATLTRELAGGSDPGRARITAMEDGVFHAVLVTGGREFDARPSDAVAVALRLGWPVECSEQLMDEVGVEVEESSGDEVEKFREFLESINPDDFEQGPTEGSSDT